MDLRPFVTASSVTNQLPKMYESWTQFYELWQPWIYSTGERHISLTQWENGQVITYEIDWTFVFVSYHKELNKMPELFRGARQMNLFRWLRKFWTGKGHV